jgi:hypothetical protein
VAYLVRTIVFFAGMGLGLWGFIALDTPWNFAAFIGAFLVCAPLSMWSFARLATPEQRKADLVARLFND